MSNSPYIQYGMYAFLAVTTLTAIYLKILPLDVGVPVFSGLVGTVVGWHIPSPQTPLTTVNTPQATIQTKDTSVTEVLADIAEKEKK